MYTDGLVEDRGEDYDESVQRMLGGLELWSRHSDGATADGPDAALDRLADLLTRGVTERHSRPDDVALLLLHRTDRSALRQLAESTSAVAFPVRIRTHRVKIVGTRSQNVRTVHTSVGSSP